MFVEDEDDRAGGRWVPGTPQSRILNKQGFDAYLSVEYHWDDGDYYVQDFGPGHVRMRGQTVTVAGMLLQEGQGASSSADSACREVVLQCIQTDGVDISSLPVGDRAIAFSVSDGGGRIRATVGRQYQPETFERWVRNQQRLGSISRIHFKLSWDPGPGGLQLTRLSTNPLLVDGKILAPKETVSVSEGTRLMFHGQQEKEPPFLTLRVMMRPGALVTAEGEHPAVSVTSRQWATALSGSDSVTPRGSPTPAEALLECVKAAGTEVKVIPKVSRAVALSVGEPIVMGRLCQLGFFEKLLEAQPRWISFVSRKHIQVTLNDTSKATVENLSNNVLSVNKVPVPKGGTAVINRGDSIEFLAMDGSTEMKFLEFKLTAA